MQHTALTPVFVGLRTGLHGLFVALTALVIVRAVVAPTDSEIAVISLALVLLGTYGAGGVAARATSRLRAAGVVWLTALTIEWVVLLWLTPDAAYLVFPLFFLYLHVVGSWWGTIAIIVSTAIAICALGIHGEWTVGGIVGPIVGAAVALLIGLGY
ncbi:sensor histidine kinase, partial [Microbacterium sp. NPDC079356]